MPPNMDDAPLTPSEHLVLERAERDFEEGVEWLRHRLRQHATSGGAGVIGRAMELGVAGAVGMLHLRPRHRDDVLLLLGLARRVHAGEHADSLATENLARVLRLREVGLVARVRDPDFHTALAYAQRMLAARLPDLARMTAVPQPRDYADLVVRAFPDPGYVLGFVEENRTIMREMLDHVETHPRILRVPHGWVPQITALAREVVDWEAQRIHASVRGIYGIETKEA